MPFVPSQQCQPTAESIIKIVSSISFETSLIGDGEDDGYETSCEWEDGEDNEEYYFAEQSYDEGEYNEEGHENAQEESQVVALLHAFLPSSPTLPRVLDMVLWRPNRPATPAAAVLEDRPKNKTKRGGRKSAELRRLKAVTLKQDAEKRMKDTRTFMVWVPLCLALVPSFLREQHRSNARLRWFLRLLSL